MSFIGNNFFDVHVQIVVVIKSLTNFSVFLLRICLENWVIMTSFGPCFCGQLVLNNLHFLWIFFMFFSLFYSLLFVINNFHINQYSQTFTYIHNSLPIHTYIWIFSDIILWNHFKMIFSYWKLTNFFVIFESL